jgi:protocatechuate 3,4-dioxygenase beta subunit
VRLALFALAAILAIDQSTPQRDRSVQPAGTGTVRGRIVSAATGDPLHRVQVTLSGGAQTVRPAVTDTRGDYQIPDVPAGSYTVTARRLGYLTAQYGQRGERGRPVVIASGEVVPRIDFSLVRGATIAGTISDELGMDYPGVRVDALEYRYLRGRRTAVTAATTTTDDLGQYRLSGLPAGQYLIRASTLDTWTNDESTSSYAFVPTYYPGVSALSDSETVALAVSQELTSVNLALRPGRTARIIGRYEATSVPVSGQSVSLSLITRTIGNAVQSSGAAGSARTNQDGAFEFRNLAPGEYTVSTGGDTDRGNVTVVLSEGDERAVVIGPRLPSPIIGTVRVDSDQPPRFAANRLRVVTVAADPDYLPPNTFVSAFGNVGTDWSFRYADLAGAYLFRLEGLPDDWLLAGVSMNGNDLTDVPLEIGPGRPARGPLQLTITNKAAVLTGHVLDADDRPAPDATIVVFAADASRWTVASRFIKIARPRSDGQFTVSGLIPGRYLAVARPSIAEGQWEDPAFLKSLVDTAAPFEARLDEPTTLDFRLVKAP